MIPSATADEDHDRGVGTGRRGVRWPAGPARHCSPGPASCPSPRAATGQSLPVWHVLSVVWSSAASGYNSCMQMGTIDLQKLRGVGEKAFGLTKEFMGVITNNERLQQEGDAQQDRASEKLRALRKEAEAQVKEAKAVALDRKERAAQQAKG